MVEALEVMSVEDSRVMDVSLCSTSTAGVQPTSRSWKRRFLLAVAPVLGVALVIAASFKGEASGAFGTPTPRNQEANLLKGVGEDVGTQPAVKHKGLLGRTLRHGAGPLEVELEVSGAPWLSSIPASRMTSLFNHVDGMQGPVPRRFNLNLALIVHSALSWLSSFYEATGYPFHGQLSSHVLTAWADEPHHFLVTHVANFKQAIRWHRKETRGEKPALARLAPPEARDRRENQNLLFLTSTSEFDTWSAGLVMAEMLIKATPRNETEFSDFRYGIFRESCRQLFSRDPSQLEPTPALVRKFYDYVMIFCDDKFPEFKEVLSHMIAVDPLERWNVPQALAGLKAFISDLEEVEKLEEKLQKGDFETQKKALQGLLTLACRGVKSKRMDLIRKQMLVDDPAVQSDTLELLAYSAERGDETDLEIVRKAAIGAEDYVQAKALFALGEIAARGSDPDIDLIIKLWPKARPEGADINLIIKLSDFVEALRRIAERGCARAAGAIRTAWRYVEAGDAKKSGPLACRVLVALRDVAVRGCPEALEVIRAGTTWSDHRVRGHAFEALGQVSDGCDEDVDRVGKAAGDSNQFVQGKAKKAAAALQEFLSNKVSGNKAGTSE